MSDLALRDVSKIPESERTNGSSNNGNLIKPRFESIGAKADEGRKKGMTSLVETPLTTNGTESSGAMLANSEVEYIESENLKDVEDLETCLKTLLSELGSKDWVSVCDALNNLRRLSIFHREDIVSMLTDMISLVVKSLKNPRSAVCKTAIMASADIFRAYNDDIIDSLDPLLVQLLLKSSQDKKFVCEAAEIALIALTSSVSPLLLLPKLQPYIKNRNPRIRAKASMCISRSVPRLGVDGIEAFGIDKLIQIGASQLSDQLPESRDAARTLLLELQSVYEKSHVPEPTGLSEEPFIASWEHFCQSKLSPLSAQAVLRVTNIAREGLVLDS
ncbi:uncharacterized protein LOC105167705 [Sesamum indicum]|uniref:Uncharacterized protein LOC105167705 n=1 Tax=Sesamum indicum TaxID=4182 RepID=A0A6I9TKA7_SESIN|nr:uncharacterized protein LOC105167705 [Sesamum indicum]XP_011085816.1 uncharacterized protein LOC105167705 [Sesamum indicum]XP_011085817.1 uncharacterized protein LOC105167705 [Sesamum indicum]XP_011085820.1 uncharacterized protein LOC105167705 [Sesamum indicum]